MSSSASWKKLAFPERLNRRLHSALQAWIRRRGPTQPPLTLHYRQIYILPTRFGWAIGLLLSAMMLGSLNFNNNLGLFTTFLVSGIGLLAMHAAHRNLDGIRIASTGARPVFAGDALELDITLRESRGRARFGLVATTAGDGPVRGVDLAADGAATVRVEMPTQRRGRLELPRIRLRTRYPIGWFEAWSWFWPGHRALVWPRPADDAPPLPASATGDATRRPGDESDEFHGLREWREGDPLHRIAWKASQRHQQLLARQFTRPERERLVLRLAEAPASDRERRIAIVARWVLEAERLEWVYGLDLGTVEIDSGSGRHHRNRCLDALAELP